VAQGLDLHADPHDVFALQTHGSKRWVVHAPGEAEPWDLELRAGDVLYLPAGTRHAAQTIDRPSLHLTIGVRTIRWRDLLRRAIDDVLDDPRFAGSLPPGWAARPDALASTLQDRVRELVGVLTVELPAVDHCAAEAEAFLTSRTPDLSGGLRDLLELDELSDHTTLRRRPGTLCRIRPGGQRIELVLGDRTLRLPAALLAAVERITERERFAPADLDDLLDAGSRRVLCRRLVREGLLTFDRGDGRPPTGEPPRGRAVPAGADAVATGIDAGV
jgi:bifunctional lysine-specific demethylase and histidyl-hydroxylase NO66